MSNTVIKVEEVGKLYKLGEIGTGTISHDLNRWWARMRGKEDPSAKVGMINDRATKGGNDWVWALKDINFEVKQGEVLGIIGRNGAGKSTLLKLLSKVTSPTTGNIKVKGRIASLLEVGTGFHPELTGRENIYLNGAILGMTKAEIKRKFDEIVDFAGVERYIDTPVKRYSSGMYVRLAFAVAAHLEPEILIVDEVLAVGDAEFQRKCIGKMKDVSDKDGRTVLFVSHNLSQVQSLCTKGIVLDKGGLIFNGETNSAIYNYVHGERKTRSIDLSSYPRAGNAISGFQFTEFSIISPEDNIYEGGSVKFKIGYSTTESFKEALVGITISDVYQTLIECRSTGSLNELEFPSNQQGDLEVVIPLQLKAGNYTINIGARAINGLLEYIPSVTTIEILPDPQSITEEWKKKSGGVLITDSVWQTNSIAKSE
jgi:lipopolysaccharide transport system ATP-binding protein